MATARSKRPRRHKRRRTRRDNRQAAIVLTALCLLFAVGSAVGYGHALLDQRAYHAAADCGPSAVQSCRWQGSGTVAKLGTSSGRYTTSYYVNVRAGSGTFKGWLDESAWLALHPGQMVEVEIWNGGLSMLDGAQTRSNPDWDVQNGHTLLLLTACMLGLALIFAAGTYVTWRRDQTPAAA